MGLWAITTAVLLGRPLSDPDGSFLGPSWVRLPVLCLGALALDLIPRAIWFSRGRITRIPQIVRGRWRSHWSIDRIALVALGITGFYVIYVSYRNLKSFLPLVSDRMYDRELHVFDRALAFGQEPSVVIHHLLGTEIAAWILSSVYLLFIPGVAILLTAWLVWSQKVSHGWWFVTSQGIAWTLGTISYYALPTLGPGLAYPSLYSSLGHTNVSDLMNALVTARQTFLWGDGRSQTVAGFASLHAGITLLWALMVQFTVRSRAAKLLMWAYFGLVVLATLYFGWHYIADDIAGIAIAVFSFRVGAIITGHGSDRLGLRAHQRRWLPSRPTALARTAPASKAPTQAGQQQTPPTRSIAHQVFASARIDLSMLFAIVLAGTVVASVLTYSHENPPDPSGQGQLSAVTSKRPDLVFAAWGNDAEVAAYQTIIDRYNADSATSDVKLEAWPTAEAMLTAMQTSAVHPDLYLLPREDLAETIAEGRNRPLGDLLDARGVDLGDNFSRDAAIAFSAENKLQCMPYATSPMVIYYNTTLINFEKMAARGLPVPDEEHTSWSLEDFRAAARFASRPPKGTKGVYISPTLQSLAPFVYSGGGDLVDNDTDPTSLSLADSHSADALREALHVLKGRRITLTTQQLREKPALDWFKQGKLGMIAGYRDLTPELRSAPGLHFDVMPMPRLDHSATVGDLTGVCIAEGPQDRVEESADFLVHLISDDSVRTVSETGYLMPTKLSITFTDAFLQPEQQPANAKAFINATPSIMVPPLIAHWRQLETTADHTLRRLMRAPTLHNLDRELTSLDQNSRPILATH